MTDTQIERIGKRVTPIVLALAVLLVGYRIGEIVHCGGWQCEQVNNYVAEESRND